MKKRILSILLAAVMVMAVLPISIWAEESAAHEHTVCNNSSICVEHRSTPNNHGDPVEWDPISAIPTEAGNYYLTGDVVIDATWTVSVDTKLCLNGKTLSLKNGKNGSVIEVQGGATLTLCDCVGTGSVIGINARTNSNPGGAVYILSGGTFNLYSGTITDNIVTNAYGDRDVYNCGTFNMYGGIVTGSNSANYKHAKNGTWPKSIIITPEYLTYIAVKSAAYGAVLFGCLM